jgi:hypothetical protein
MIKSLLVHELQEKGFAGALNTQDGFAKLFSKMKN